MYWIKIIFHFCPNAAALGELVEIHIKLPDVEYSGSPAEDYKLEVCPGSSHCCTLTIGPFDDGEEKTYKGADLTECEGLKLPSLRLYVRVA